MSDKHWTEESEDSFRIKIATDFAWQLEAKMDEAGVTQNDLAKLIGVTKSRVSQILNNPGNLTLDLMIRCARALGMKVAVLAYSDGDTENTNGPINSEIFRTCWERLGRPADAWDLDDAEVAVDSSPEGE